MIVEEFLERVDVLLLGIAIAAAASWLGAIWRSRRYIHAAFQRRSTRTLSALLLIAAVVIAGFVRPIAGPEAFDLLRITWATLEGIAFLVGLSYLIAGPPAGVPPI